MKPITSGYHAALALGTDTRLNLSNRQSAIFGFFQRIWIAVMANEIVEYGPGPDIEGFVQSHGFCRVGNRVARSVFVMLEYSDTRFTFVAPTNELAEEITRHCIRNSYPFSKKDNRFDFMNRSQCRQVAA